MNNKTFVKEERAFTVSTLNSLTEKQWQAKTLCDGWSIEDLAAHLVSRERNIIGGIGLIIPSLQTLHDKRIERVKSHGHDYMIHKLSKYPWYMPASLNVAEFWVHNEDLLRGDLQMSRAKPSSAQNIILWNSLKGISKVRKSLVSDVGNVDLVNTQTNEAIYIRFNSQSKITQVSGTAGEVLLFFYGRRKAANIHIS